MKHDFIISREILLLQKLCIINTIEKYIKIY